MRSAPPLPEGLLEWLLGLFPDQIPTNPCTPEEFYVLTGQQQVIRRVAGEFRRQNDNLLR